MAQRQWRGGAVQAKLSSGITGTPPTFVTDVATGFPTGTLPFVVTIGRGLASEEKLLVTRAGTTTFTVVTRGYDNTASIDHAAQATVEHTVAAVILDEADAHIYDVTRDDHTQYLKQDGTEAPTGISNIAAAPVASAPGDTVSKGSGPTLALSDHRHAREAAPIYWIGHTFAVAGEILVPVGDLDFINPLFVPVAAGRTVKLAKCRYKINTGTSVTAKLQINGVDATGFTGISVTTTVAETDPANITLADGDRLALVVTAVSGTPKNMSFTCVLEHA